MSNSTESWGSRVGLILAMAGNAVGLGNFLRFPVQAVQNGGRHYYSLLGVFSIDGYSLLWIEWAMGRFGGRYGDHSTLFILDNMTKKDSGSISEFLESLPIWGSWLIIRT